MNYLEQVAQQLEQDRRRKPGPSVITVRMTAELKQALDRCAWAHHTSLNRLCIATLQAMVDQFAASQQREAEA